MNDTERARVVPAEVDKNMTPGAADADGLVWYNVKGAPFEIYGLYEPQAEGDFCRMPDDVAATVNPGVRRNARHTAGGRIRFCTDSGRLALRVRMPYVTKFPHMALTGSSSFDVYEDTDVGSAYVGVFKISPSSADGFEMTLKLGECRRRALTVNFPLYSPVSEVMVGLDAGAALEVGRKYGGARLPVVFYGSSITQGACASRPGLAYQAVISRRLDLDFVNLGFSGNARGEDTMVEYMASLSMSAFVSDYDHNAPTVDHLRATHLRMYQKIRESHPDIPYIMLSRPDFASHSESDSERRRRVIEDTFRAARDTGDKRVWYIDGEGIYRGFELDACTVDNDHPTDLGFMKMADAIGRILRRAMRQGL